MKTFWKVIGAILSLLALYIFFIGLKECFTCKKAYIEKYDAFEFHSTPACPVLGVNEMDIEYMAETGKITGSKEASFRECWNDIALDMCDYCFSQYDIKERNDYLMEALAHNSEETFIKMRDKAREKRREQEEENFRKEHPEYFK